MAVRPGHACDADSEEVVARPKSRLALPECQIATGDPEIAETTAMTAAELCGHPAPKLEARREGNLRNFTKASPLQCRPQ